MVFPNGSLYVRYCVQIDESQFGKHLLAIHCVQGIMKHSKEMHSNFLYTRKGE